MMINRTCALCLKEKERKLVNTCRHPIPNITCPQKCRGMSLRPTPLKETLENIRYLLTKKGGNHDNLNADNL